MKVTKVQLTADKTDSNQLAFGQVVLDDVLVITGVNVVQGKKPDPFVSLPQRKSKKDGEYKDIVFPKTKDLRHEINEKVMEKYKEIAG